MSSHAHGSSRYWEHWVHPAPPALSYKSTHALHSAADRSDEVLQFCPPCSQNGLVVPLHWLAAVAATAPAPSAADRASSRASSSAEGLGQRELIESAESGCADTLRLWSAERLQRTTRQQCLLRECY